MKKHRYLLSLFLPLLLVCFSFVTHAQEKDDVVVYSGYYSRDENDGELARISGNSHYVKFFEKNRFIRLYIPYPYSVKVKSEDISKIFALVNKRTIASAYIKDDFGILDEKIIAHIDVIRRINGDIMYDCGLISPCKVVFGEDSFKVLKKGIAKDHVTLYHHINE